MQHGYPLIHKYITTPFPSLVHALQLRVMGLASFMDPIKSNSIKYKNCIIRHIVVLSFQFLNIFCWLLAATLACMVLYGQHDDVNGNRFTREVGSLYITVHRTVWGACVAWVIFACANGYGGRYDKNTESKSILQTRIISACACVPNVTRVCGLSILN